MALILSRAIQKQKPRRVLICGDSFFYDQKPKFPGLHWSTRLPDNWEITNAARAGSSNAMIMQQYLENYDWHDLVILGFTGNQRIEFDRPFIAGLSGELVNTYVTNCHKTQLSQEELDFYENYVKYTNLWADVIKQCGIIFGLIEMAKTNAQVCYSLNIARETMRDISNQYPNHLYPKKIMAEELPFNLADYHRRVEDNGSIKNLDDTSWPVFHVRNPEAQQRFADQIVQAVDESS